MLLIVIILLVSFILVPLLELTLKDYVLLVAKVLVYAVTLVYVAWELFAAGHHAILT
jgi:hypothetical protein